MKKNTESLCDLWDSIKSTKNNQSPEGEERTKGIESLFIKCFWLSPNTTFLSNLSTFLAGLSCYYTIYTFSLTSRLLKRVDTLFVHSIFHLHSAFYLHHNSETAPWRATFLVVSQWSIKLPFFNPIFLHSFLPSCLTLCITHHPSFSATASVTSHILYYLDAPATCQIIHQLGWFFFLHRP